MSTGTGVNIVNRIKLLMTLFFVAFLSLTACSGMNEVKTDLAEAYKERGLEFS
jgi:hypothetical protein